MLASKLLVEVAGIGAAVDGREVWRRDTLVENVIPANVSEERLALDFDSIVLARAQPPLRVPGEKLQITVSELLPKHSMSADILFARLKQRRGAL